MRSSAEPDSAAFLYRTRHWIDAYMAIGAAAVFFMVVTGSPAALPILAGLILLLEKIRRAREADLRGRDDAPPARKVLIAAKRKGA